VEIGAQKRKNVHTGCPGSLKQGGKASLTNMVWVIMTNVLATIAMAVAVPALIAKAPLCNTHPWDLFFSRLPPTPNTIHGGEIHCR